ncbi:MAG: hypothetical protein IPM95_06965 [Sphingobacteriales bacterium]|nr:hypothetical protein [Sphingobacteriales bacterium]
MKKLFYLLLFTYSLQIAAQTACTDSARAYINRTIKTNNIKAITAAQMNAALTKILLSINCNDSLTRYRVDSIKTVNDSLYIYQHTGGLVKYPQGGGGIDTIYTDSTLTGAPTITQGGTLKVDTTRMATRNYLNAVLTGKVNFSTLADSTAALRMIRKVDTTWIGFNSSRDSILQYSYINGILQRIPLKRDSVTFSGWSTTGNSGLSGGYPGTNFIGTTDNQNVAFKRNNVWMGGFYSDGFKIGTGPGDNKFIEAQGNTTGNQATGNSFVGYGNFLTYSTNNYGLIHFNGSSKQMAFGIGTDGITRLATGTSGGTGVLMQFTDDQSGTGGVSIGGNVETSAKLTVTSSAKGVLISRMTSTERDAIASPDNWLMIICTNCTATDGSTGVLQIWNGTTWKNAY